MSEALDATFRQYRVKSPYSVREAPMCIMKILSSREIVAIFSQRQPGNYYSAHPAPGQAPRSHREPTRNSEGNGRHLGKGKLLTDNRF